MKKAVIIGASGILSDTVEALAANNWQVTAIARNPNRFPASWESLGVECVTVQRSEADQISAFLEGADLLVDSQTYLPNQAMELAGWSQRVGSTVQLSSSVVYADATGIIDEDRPIVDWRGEALNSQRGYAANKAQCERVLAADGERVSVLRLGKVHGAGCRRPREWSVVKRLLDQRHTILLPGDGLTKEATTSTKNLASAILACAEKPGGQALNVCDGQPITVQEMVEAIAVAMNVADQIAMCPSPLGSEWQLPWYSDRELDFSRYVTLTGQQPLNYRDSVTETVRWLAGVAQRAAGGWQLPDWLDTEFFDGAFPYRAEDEYLSRKN